MQLKWIDANDEHPDFDKRVLVMVIGDNPRYEVSTYSIVDGALKWTGLGENDEVSYWSNLRNFPEKADTFTTLNNDQTNHLYDHLKTKFKDEESYFYLNIIIVDIEAFNEAINGSEKVYEDASYFSKKSSDLYELYHLCEKYPYLVNYKSSCWALAGGLKELAKHALQDEHDQIKKQGRPSTTQYRKDLIKSIYGCYDKIELGLKVKDSHFEKTVEIVLKMVEGINAPDDIHSTIMRALKY